MQTPPDPLDPLWERWRAVAPTLERSVAPDVWRRIRNAAPSETRNGWWSRVEAVFAPPAFAFVFVTACVLLGLFLAEIRLSRWQAERTAQLARSYVRLIDPLLENPGATSGAASPSR